MIVFVFRRLANLRSGRVSDPIYYGASRKSHFTCGYVQALELGSAQCQKSTSFYSLW